MARAASFRFATQSQRRKKSRGRPTRLGSFRRGSRTLGFQGVADNGFEDGNILEETSPAFIREPDQRLGPVARMLLRYFHKTGFAERLQVPAQVAVRELAQVFEVVEQQ